MHYVIIGNSAAGIGTVEGIRQVDTEGKITIISSECHHTYSRPLISYYLQGKTDEQKMKYRPDDFYSMNKCEVMLGKTVKAIDKTAKSVVLDDGTMIPYDKLLIATGSTPFVPPFEGLDTVENPCTFMSFDDAKALEQQITCESRVLIIGAGLIGLKCAEGIFAKVASISVIDLSPRILSSILDEEAAGLVQAHIESKGIRFLLGRSVKRFDKDTAVMDNGDVVSFDVLVLAVGVRPSTKLFTDIGGTVGRGILTNTLMQTSIPDIYAAGDCTESYDVSCDQSRILALLPNAYRQGECAGINMAVGNSNENSIGIKEFDHAIAMNAIGFFGLHIITAGSYTGEIFEHKTSDSYKKLFYKDDLLKGYILIGNVDKAGIYTALIRNKIPLSELDFDLICEKPSLIAFSKKFRTEKLGGVV